MVVTLMALDRHWNEQGSDDKTKQQKQQSLQYTYFLYNETY